MIELKHISRTFYTGGHTVHAVQDASLQIQRGKIYGIMGFSGAGKSTLVRCINLLERPSAGQVLIDGIDITALPEKQLRQQRKKIGMIFQQFNLFASRNVFSNIAYPLRHTGKTKAEIKEKVDSLLELVGLTDKAAAYPSQLSGGQKQRVAIARALANDPQILLSDEATSALDPQTTKSILRLLREVNQKLGITTVIVTHEMAVIKEICQQVVVMENGRIVEEGDVFELFSNPKTKITRDFVDGSSNLSKITELIQNGSSLHLKPNEILLRLRYLERNTSEPLISQISRNYDLDVNILFGNIELIEENPIGGLVAAVSGTHDNITAAVRYLSEKNVIVEVIPYATTA